MKRGKKSNKGKKTPARKKAADSSLIKSIKRVALFKGLSTVALGKLLAKAEIKTIQKDEFVFHAGAVSDGPYVNLQGELRIENNGLFLSNVDEGESVGEMGVLNDWPRSADLIAITQTKVLFIPKVHLTQLMKKDGKIALTIYKNAVMILGTLIRNKNIVMEFSKILDDSVLAATSSDEIKYLQPNVE
ncbi:MAG: hypothetical protein A2X86_21130 [Bdellovibrionales bacterium GWA2_49_15]|nr:MAG: hypothetical protein A2X86_21130 [Bdellovibrionales bacterium GWA2_49_15]HAZ14882.1 hypothetical protein [Bdellovibrionales bacterium]